MKNFRIEAIILAIGLLLLGVFIEKGFSKFAEKTLYARPVSQNKIWEV